MMAMKMRNGDRGPGAQCGDYVSLCGADPDITPPPLPAKWFKTSIISPSCLAGHLEGVKEITAAISATPVVRLLSSGQGSSSGWLAFVVDFERRGRDHTRHDFATTDLSGCEVLIRIQ